MIPQSRLTPGKELADVCRKIQTHTFRLKGILRAQEESIIEKTLQTLCQEELAAF
jgi:hypothetical protein